MKELTLYLRPLPRNRRLLFGVIAIFAGLIYWLGLQILQDQQELLLLQRQEQRLRMALAAKPAPKVSRAEQDAQQRWNALAVERKFDWKPLFAALESVGNPDIELMEFQPDKVGRTVLLRGEAKDEDSLIAFVDALSMQPLFSHVHLTHRKLKKRDRLITVAFELKAGIQIPK